MGRFLRGENLPVNRFFTVLYVLINTISTLVNCSNARAHIREIILYFARALWFTPPHVARVSMGIRLPNLRDYTKAKKGGPVYMARIWKMGQSVVFPLHKLLLQVLDAKPDDCVIVRVHPPYVTFRMVVPEELIPVKSFMVEDFPPKLPKAEPHA
jgi:hypothetical protein